MENSHSQKNQPDRVDKYMEMVPKITQYLDFRYSEVVTEGLENIADGPAMYVANHLAVDDSLAIAAVYAHHTGRPLRIGAKSEYFEGAGITKLGLFKKQVKKFVEDTQQLPVYREGNARGGVQLGKDLKHRLSIGESVLFHGEGTRSVDGRINRFKRGAAAYAVKNSVPAGPTSVTYGRTPFNFRKYVKVEFGTLFIPPTYGMDFNHYRLIPDGLVDAIAPRLMNQSERIDTLIELLELSVSEMSGQDRSGYYLDPYTKKLIIPTEPER